MQLREAERKKNRDVTQSNVSSSDFIVYRSRNDWTLDEILIWSEKTHGQREENKNKKDCEY